MLPHCLYILLIFISVTNGTTRYTIKTYVADVKSAGTDSDVSVEIIGTAGTTGEHDLDASWHDDFERGDSREYVFDDIDVGDITCVRMKIDGGNALLISQIQIGGKFAHNIENIWISSDTGDDDGKAQPNLILCIPCNRGDFRDNDNDNCEPCPAKTYTDKTGSRGCKECAEGEVPNAERISCVQCDKGYFRDNDNDNCQQCPDKTYTDETGSRECKDCAAGQVPNAERTSCERCSRDTYWTEDKICKECPHGTRSPDGSKSVEACVEVNCMENKYWTEEKICKDCLPGYSSRPGSTSEEDCKKDCGWPQVDDYSVFEPNQTARYGDEVIVSCKANYNLHGNGVVTCLEGGQFSTIPTCLPKYCTSNTLYNHVLITEPQLPVTNGTVIILGCPENQVLIGDATVLCVNGNLTYKSQPDCQTIEKEETGKQRGGEAADQTLTYGLIVAGTLTGVIIIAVGLSLKYLKCTCREGNNLSRHNNDTLRMNDLYSNTIVQNEATGGNLTRNSLYQDTIIRHEPTDGNRQDDLNLYNKACDDTLPSDCGNTRDFDFDEAENIYSNLDVLDCGPGI